MKRCVLVLLTLLSLLGAQKTNIAVLELTGNGVSGDDVAGLSNRLRIELFKTGKFTIVERSMMKEILEEHEFQNTGCTDSDCAVQIGQILNVDKMVAGSIDKVGSVFTISIRLINVATGEIEHVANDDCINCSVGEVLVTSIGNAAKELVGEEVHSTQRDTNAQQSQAITVTVETQDTTATPTDKQPLLKGFLFMGGIVMDFPAHSLFSMGAEAGILTRRNWLHAASFSMGESGNNAALFYHLSKKITINKVFSFAPGISMGYKELFWQPPKGDPNEGTWQNEEWFSTFGGIHLRLALEGKRLGLMAKTAIDFGRVDEKEYPGSEHPGSYFAPNIYQTVMLTLFIPKK